jgi:hypothetical protein
MRLRSRPTQLDAVGANLAAELIGDPDHRDFMIPE